MAKKAKKKSRIGKTFVLAVLIGIGLATLLLFKDEIIHLTKPGSTKQGLVKDQRTVVKEQKSILLYFSDEEGEYLMAERDRIPKRDTLEQEARELLQELIRGPKGKLIPTLPRGTKLLNLQVDEKGVAKVSFNKALTAEHPGGTSAEIMTVYSVVNSLTTNFPQIKRVQILVEGREIETIAGHISLSRPIPSKPDLIRNH